MKKTFRFSAFAVAALALAAGSASAENVYGGSTVQAHGGLSNSVNASAVVNGVGSVNALAGSTGLSSGAITASSIKAQNYPSVGGVTTMNLTQTNTISGAVDTKITGYAGLIGSGPGASGSAGMTGWADAGTSGHTTSTVDAHNGNYATIGGSGSVDAGAPTKVGHGPDVSLSTTTLNSGVTAGGVAGGSFGLTTVAHVDGVNGRDLAASVSDVKTATAYAATDFGNLQVGAPGANGSVLLTPANGSVTQLNSGADAVVNASGLFNISLTK